MDVSVIIVNYNTVDLTVHCIDSIYKHTVGLYFEVIVVDNNSSDQSVDILSKDKRISFIQNAENVGFGAANNIGYRHAKGKYLFLLNSDTILLNNAIGLFYEFAEKRKFSTVYGGVLLNSDLTYGHSYGNFPTIKSELKFLINLPFKKRNEIYVDMVDMDGFNVDYITGADLFLARSIFENVGLFDTDFFLYYEETDLQKRMSIQGVDRFIMKTPKIIHYNGGSSKKKRSQRADFHGFESQFRYIKKYNHYLNYLVYRLMAFLILFPLVFYWSTKRAKLNFLRTLFCQIN